MINNITSYFNADGTPTVDGIRYFREVAQRLGADQSWQNVTGSRAHSTSYRNDTLRPIQVAINASTTVRPAQVSADNTTWVDVALVGDVNVVASFIVPAGHYYRVNGSTTLVAWSELR